MTSEPSSPTSVVRSYMASFETRDADTIAPLHDDLFPGSHTPGHRLIPSADDTHLRLVAERDGEPVGYVALERTPDREAYIDFLGAVYDTANI